MNEERQVRAIVGLFIVIAASYALLTPVFEASDELWHYPMVQTLSQGNDLPVQVMNAETAGPWKQEASQPPLYYYLGALITFWIDSGDMANVRRLNPHVDVGMITPDGNINLVVHDTSVEATSGTVLAVRIVRLFSVLLGATTVYLTYLLAKEVTRRSEARIGAVLFVAFTPMFAFISGSVNNDNLVIPLAALGLLLVVRQVTRPRQGSAQRTQSLALLGTVVGLGALTKITALGLLPLAAGAIFVGEWSSRRFTLKRREFLFVGGRWASSFGLVLLCSTMVAGWWYLRNIRLYGDWTGWNAFVAVLGQRSHPASLAQLWDERWGFMQSYWGLFGGLNVPMPSWIYQLLDGAGVLALAGLGLGLIRLGRRRIIGHGAVSREAAGRWIVIHFGTIACVLWSLAVIFGLIRWATITWSSQGRLVFSAIFALSILFVMGLLELFPERWAWKVVAVTGGAMVVLTALAPWLWIRPAYQEGNFEAPQDLRPASVAFGDEMELEGFQVGAESLTPGDQLEVILEWEALRKPRRDWSVFVHLNDPILEIPVAQRDMYPGQGLVATSSMDRGDRLTDRLVLTVPRTAVAPSEVDVIVGLYDYATGERLPSIAGMGTAALGKIKIKPAAGDLPNATAVNFENQLELRGFTIEPRRVKKAGQITLSLYWRASEALTTDYTFFAQVLDEDTTRWASDDQAQPTSTWRDEQLEQITMTLAIDPQTPSGIYPVIIGVYTRDSDGGFERLQSVTPEGRLTDDFVILTQIRVD